MKVLLLIDSLVKGGRERRLLELLKGFSKQKDMEVCLVLFSNQVEYPEVYDLNIPIYKLERKPKKDPRVFYKLYRIFRNEKPDLAHSWGIMPSIYAIPTTKLLGIPLINACIADAPDDMGFFDKRYFRAKLTFPFSDVIIANSEAGLSAYQVPSEKGVCVYNGFDFNRIGKLEDKEQVRKALNIKTEKVVGMVGAFFDRKDYGTYLEAASIFLEKHHDVTFLAVGGGPNLEGFKGTIPEKHKERIVFTGMIHKVESVVNVFDIGVLTTYTEGISNSIMEYMVLGKPVIATDGGGTKELILDGQTGFLIQQKDVAGLVEKLALMLDQPGLRKEMGLQGKARIKEQFSLERMEKDYLDLYQQIIKKKIVLPA